MKFFLRADKDAEGKDRVRVFVEQENGFIGIAGDVHKSVQPHLWTKFNDWVKEGGDKLEAECIAKGEVRPPIDARPTAVVEREIIAKEDEIEGHKEALKGLNDELKESKSASKPAAKKAAPKKEAKK